MNPDKFTETEVKIFLPERIDLEQEIIRLGGQLIKSRVFEQNIRYDDSNHDLISEAIVLRLRKDNKFRLTYKSPGTVVDGIVSRFEAEVEVSDFDTMNLILERLGFRKHMMYEKYRTTYELDGCEIVFDELPYGNFLEIEGASEEIESIITKLRLTDAHRMNHSYVNLFDRLRNRLDLTFTDLTFTNFNDVSAPPETIIEEGTK